MNEQIDELRRFFIDRGHPSVLIAILDSLEEAEDRQNFEDHGDPPERREPGDPRSPNGGDYNELWTDILHDLQSYAMTLSGPHPTDEPPDSPDGPGPW